MADVVNRHPFGVGATAVYPQAFPDTELVGGTPSDPPSAAGGGDGGAVDGAASSSVAGVAAAVAVDDAIAAGPAARLPAATNVLDVPAKASVVADIRRSGAGGQVPDRAAEGGAGGENDGAVRGADGSAEPAAP